MLDISDISFKAMDGIVNCDLIKINGTVDDRFVISCRANANGINISKLFYEFENFDQNFISDHHLKGNADATMALNTSLHPDLQVNYDDLHIKTNITVKDGELNNMKPLMAMQEHIKENKNLENVRFSTITNQIEIKGRQVIIPNMAISTSAMNIDISGHHGFDNKIDYHLKLLWEEVVGKKKGRKTLTEFGEIEDEKRKERILFLRIKGYTDDFKVTPDAKAYWNKKKQDWREEKDKLKVVLNQEFGLFKNDSAVVHHKEKDKEKKKGFNVFFEEEPIEKPKKPAVKEGEGHTKKVIASKKKKEDEEPDFIIEFEE